MLNFICGCLFGLVTAAVTYIVCYVIREEKERKDVY